MRLRCFAGCLTSSWPPSYPGEEVGVPCPSGPPSCSLLEAQAGGRPTLEREASLRGWRGLICLEGETPGPAGCSRAPTYPGALRGFRTSWVHGFGDCGVSLSPRREMMHPHPTPSPMCCGHSYTAPVVLSLCQLAHRCNRQALPFHSSHTSSLTSASPIPSKILVLCPSVISHTCWCSPPVTDSEALLHCNLLSVKSFGIW